MYFLSICRKQFVAASAADVCRLDRCRRHSSAGAAFSAIQHDRTAAVCRSNHSPNNGTWHLGTCPRDKSRVRRLRRGRRNRRCPANPKLRRWRTDVSLCHNTAAEGAERLSDCRWGKTMPFRNCAFPIESWNYLVLLWMVYWFYQYVFRGLHKRAFLIQCSLIVMTAITKTAYLYQCINDNPDCFLSELLLRCMQRCLQW